MTKEVTRADVDALIGQILEEDFEIESDRIRPEATMESLGLDSLDLVEISQIVEQRYGIRLRGEDATSGSTLSDITDMVMGKAMNADAPSS